MRSLQLDLWDAVGLVLLVALLGVRLRVARAGGEGRAHWRLVAFCAGWALALAAILTPLDRLGEGGLLAAHVGQHILLGDLAAPLLMLGLAPAWSRWLRVRFARLEGRRGRAWGILRFALSPVGAAVVWTAATYFWLIPSLHLLAAPAGLLQLVDQLSFLGFGALVWLGAFDPRSPQDARNGLRRGGLPWWGRHVYAMVSRLAMLPPALVIWLASPGTYHDLSDPWQWSVSRSEDGVIAASVWIGFEMLLFSLAVFLGFIFLILSEGRRRAAGGSS